MTTPSPPTPPSAITLRNARSTIEDWIVDLLWQAYGTRLALGVAQANGLRGIASAALPDRSLTYVSGVGYTYQWKRFDTTADDGLNALQPSDVPTGKPGRWVVTSSTASIGYLKRCELYNDDGSDIDTIEQRLFAGLPAMLLSFEEADHEPRSTIPGALYWSRYRFTLLAVSTSARGGQAARQGSPIASEAATDPGTAAMIGDAKALLAGFDLGLNDVAMIQIMTEAPVVKDLARSRFVEALDLEVRVTLTNPDTGTTALGDPFEFNQQLLLADTAKDGTFDASNYVVSGMQFSLGDGLTQTFAAGSLYVGGTLVNVSAAAHTFGASKVTYRDVSPAGALTYLETDVGDNEPDLTYGSVRLGVTMTDSSGVRLDQLLMASAIAYGPVDKIEPPVLTGIALSPLAPSVGHGTQLQFSATGTYADATTGDVTDLVAWTSSDTSVATIDVTGLATTIAAGTSTITASINGLVVTTTLTST